MSVAFGSEINTGIPEYSGAPDTFNSIVAFSAGITGNTGSGSSVLYEAQQQNVGGVATMFLDFATANHVTSGNANFGFNLHMGNTLVNLTGANANVAAPVARGNGNYGLPEDMSWVGLTVSQNQVNNATWQFLTALTAVNGTIASALPKSGDMLTNFGFGYSGQYLYDDFNPGANTHTDQHAATFTPGLQGNGDTYTPEGFYWSNALPAADQYGTDRYMSTISNGVFTYTNGFYMYDSMQWDLQPIAGTGQINSGDSGGAIWNGDNVIGLNTYAFGVKNAAKTQESFYYGSLGGGLAFTPQDIAWLDNQATVYAAPEPASLIGLAVLGIGALVRRRRK